MNLNSTTTMLCLAPSPRRPSSLSHAAVTTVHSDPPDLEPLDDEMSRQIVHSQKLSAKEAHRTISVKEPKSSCCRRVIFPTLHQSESPVRKDANVMKNNAAPYGTMKKSSSLDSICHVEGSHDPVLASPPLEKRLAVNEEKHSPNCVTSVAARPLPSIPSLRSAESEPWSEVQVPMLIPPLKVTTTPPKPPKEEVFGTPSYKKKIVSPHQRASPRFVVQPVRSPHGMVTLFPMSILRNKSNESVPSMVSVATSEQSSDDRRVRFDARVCVFEFSRHPREHTVTWYSPSDMEKFRRRALELVCAHATELVPTGTGRLVQTRVRTNQPLFTHERLLTDDRDDEVVRQELARSEFQNVLIVDPHDLCSRLFAKALEKMLPHCKIAITKTSEEALKRSRQIIFDLFIVEERLKVIPHSVEHECSGSALIRRLKVECAKRQPLFVGVSAYYGTDKDKLQENGASLCWPKPPPSLDKTMRDNLLKRVLILRGKEETALKYFQ